MWRTSTIHPRFRVFSHRLSAPRVSLLTSPHSSSEYDSELWRTPLGLNVGLPLVQATTCLYVPPRSGHVTSIFALIRPYNLTMGQPWSSYHMTFSTGHQFSGLIPSQFQRRLLYFSRLFKGRSIRFVLNKQWSSVMQLKSLVVQSVSFGLTY